MFLKHKNTILSILTDLSLFSKILVTFFIEKPTFITELKRETLSDYGSTVTLPCDANGVPSPTITWFRNAEPVDHLLGTRYVSANICLWNYWNSRDGAKEQERREREKRHSAFKLFLF